MDKDIRSVFERVAKHVKVDRSLIMRLSRYETEFTHRNQEHVNFFSGNLFGVEKIRFLPTDWERFFDEVLELDDTELRHAIVALPTVNEDFVVSSDVMNISCCWLVHHIYNEPITSGGLTEALKVQGMRSAALIFNYKVLTSLYAHYFKYPVNKDTAVAVYAELTKKFSLKKHGSWGALLNARVDDMIDLHGIHGTTVKTFRPDKGVLYMVTDSQGRIRDIIKTMYEVLIKVRESDTKIVATSSMVSVDGELQVGDMNRFLVAYKHYIHSVVGESTSFIKEELKELVCSALPTMNPDYLDQALQHISKRYHSDDREEYEKLIDETMVHAFDFLSKERKERNRGFDLANVIVKLRGIYQSARSQDPYLLYLRSLADDIVNIPLKGRAASQRAAVRTGVLLYIVLRALTRNSYSH